jgi:hypothetical protein
MILRKFIGLITIPPTDIAKLVGYFEAPFPSLPFLRRDSIHRSKLSSKEATQGNFFLCTPTVPWPFQHMSVK